MNYENKWGNEAQSFGRYNIMYDDWDAWDRDKKDKIFALISEEWGLRHQLTHKMVDDGLADTIVGAHIKLAAPYYKLSFPLGSNN